MTETGRPAADLATACPFVAFEADRDRRSTQPDHRHRCYAEVRPAPRALAHQANYCLAAAFPACPTFQDWAAREAARSVPAAGGLAPAVDDAQAAPAPDGDEEDYRDDLPPRPQRRPDWATPPPWVSGQEPASLWDHAAADGAGQEEHGVSAEPPSDEPAQADAAMAEEPGQPTDVDGPPAFLAHRAAARPAGQPAEPATHAAHRAERAPSGTLRAPIPPLASRAHHDAPAWEPPRRHESYPTLRTRMGLPSLPPLAVGVAALLIAALLIFAAPSLFSGGGAGPVATPTPTAVPTTSEGPSAPPPSPSAQVYLVRAGDTVSKIAKRFGLSIEELLAANPQISDPDKIRIGDPINIPTPGGGGPSAPAGGTSAP
ncbi:MAG TPA: LysM peptidoglycan-binding domain-containing protein [Candidatus Limnocylindrales bacterium]|nr:LysM peptidoglycan-binding domain-containing protein [Candidatus Limnocylindrales bacterium]